MKKAIAAALTLCLLCTGCSFVRLSEDVKGPPSNFSGSYAGIYQSGDGGNGVYDDDEKIAAKEENLYAEELAAQDLSDKENSKVGITFSKFHGKQQYFQFEAEDWEQHTVSFQLNVGKGRLKLVMLLEDGTVFPLAETDGAEGIDDSQDCAFSEGVCRFLLVGDNAEDGKVEIAIDKPNSLNEGEKEMEPVSSIKGEL